MANIWIYVENVAYENGVDTLQPRGRRQGQGSIVFSQLPTNLDCCNTKEFI